MPLLAHETVLLTSLYHTAIVLHGMVQDGHLGSGLCLYHITPHPNHSLALGLCPHATLCSECGVYHKHTSQW